MQRLELYYFYLRLRSVSDFGQIVQMALHPYPTYVSMKIHDDDNNHRIGVGIGTAVAKTILLLVVAVVKMI
jgi:hypothetical protein